MNKNQKEIDREFIQTENKYKLPYESIKHVSIDVLFDFLHELNLNSLLLMCCMHNNYELAKKLIDCGADVNYKGSIYGIAPLVFARHFNSNECIDLLIKNGAKY